MFVQKIKRVLNHFTRLFTAVKFATELKENWFTLRSNLVPGPSPLSKWRVWRRNPSEPQNAIYRVFGSLVPGQHLFLSLKLTFLFHLKLHEAKLISHFRVKES